MNVVGEFLAAFARARAEQVVETPGGFAVLSPERFPHAHDHNCLYVVEPVDPADLTAAADRLFADRTYRRIDHVAGETPDDLAAALTAAGFEREPLLQMTSRRPPDADRPASAGVVELTMDQRIDLAELFWAGDGSESAGAVMRELAERAHSAVSAARCTFLGVVGDEGVEASCDLFVRDGVAQIEEVSTLQQFRGRGHASRLVRAAAEAASGATVFLIADDDDWPKDLYARLGFDVTGRHDAWSRTVDA